MAGSIGESKALAALHLAERREEVVTERLEEAESRILVLEAQNTELLRANAQLESVISQLTNDLLEERQCQQQKDRTMKDLIQQKDDLIAASGLMSHPAMIAKPSTKEEGGEVEKPPAVQEEFAL